MAAIDDFSTFLSGPTSPLTQAFAITPHDTNELSHVTRGLYLGVSGTVKVKTVGGDDVTLVGLASGMVHPLRVRLVFATGTDANLSIVGLF